MPEFSLLTFNCFGVPTLNTARRLALLAETLNAEPLSVVCLQEVQWNPYCKRLTRAAHAYPANAYQPFLHAPKGGLLTVSRLPITQSDFVLYRARGLWYTLALFDWILHKGVLVTHMTVNDQRVVILNTHLNANYAGNWNDSNRYARLEYRQLLHLAELVQAQPDDALVIACGDFNIPRGSWLYRAFLDASGLTDPLADDMRPTFRPYPGMATRFAMPIDFTFYRTPTLPGLQVENRLRFIEPIRHNGRTLYLSDHFGVELQLRWDDIN